MRNMTAKLSGCAFSLVALLASSAAFADVPIGQIKTGTGNITVERAGAAKPIQVGERVFKSDTIVTAAGASVGITFIDNSMMSLGPSSRLSLDEFEFDTTTQKGIFNASLKKGTLAVKSGQIVRQTPDAMHIRTPAALLG